MVEIDKGKWEENGVEVIVLNGIKCLNSWNIQEQLGHENLTVITKRYPSIKIIIQCKTVEVCDFKKRLGFNLHNVINTKQ